MQLVPCSFLRLSIIDGIITELKYIFGLFTNYFKSRNLDMLLIDVCGFTRTRGYTRPDPYPRVRVGSGRCITGRVGYGYDVHGYGYTRFYPQGTRFFKILER